MSIVFGAMHTEERAVEESELIVLAQATERYAQDGTSTRASGRIGMGFQPYYTHQRSRLETEPIQDPRGNMLTFDGRLDNHRELNRVLGLSENKIEDSRIVLAAYERWGEGCFARLVGDWAVVLWSHESRSLYLARDHAGSRTLYFEHKNGNIHWSTYLETLLAREKGRELDAYYAASYLACQPTRDLTPYQGIGSVPPGHYARFHAGSVTIKAYWQPTIEYKIICKGDGEYEERFRALFEQSVRRRTGEGAPIMAELSGGMDSTSIVCMSDRLRRAAGAMSSQLIDTISYYDDSEANWNDSDYFSVVEMQRGKMGIHFPVSFGNRTFLSIPESDSIRAFPGADSYSSVQEQLFEDAVARRGYRSILSGVGGDEVLGGVPNPLPELADLLVGGDLSVLLKRTLAWCLPNRTPAIHMLVNTIGYIASLHTRPRVDMAATPWLFQTGTGSLLERIRDTREVDKFTGFSPSQIGNGIGWWKLLETLPSCCPGNRTRLEFRYPYLDRDLVEFLFSIPREQLLKPGRRRSLMRRALTGIVPEQVLERRRKASIIRGPLALIQREFQTLKALFAEPLIARYGLVDTARLDRCLELAANGSKPEYWPGLIRMAFFEIWLQHSQSGVVVPKDRSAITGLRSLKAGASRSVRA
jgi:asparagine synthase (glutamine-hydrolysing)